MFTMTVLARHSEAVTLGVGGNVSKDALAEIDRFITLERSHQRVVIDLSEVTLLDHAAARYFSDKLNRGVELVNCPRYIRHWISPQIAHEPEN